MNQILLLGITTLSLLSFCPLAHADVRIPYDGRGNNQVQITWGNAGERFVRKIPPQYEDGIQKMKEHKASAVEVAELFRSHPYTGNQRFLRI